MTKSLEAWLAKQLGGASYASHAFDTEKNPNNKRFY